MLSVSHIVLVLIVLILLFGSKRFPSIMKNLSNGLNALKKGLNDGCEDKKCIDPVKKTAQKTSTKIKSKDISGTKINKSGIKSISKNTKSEKKK